MLLRAFRITAGIVLGLVAAEGLVRLVTTPSLDFVSYVRPGPYCTDPVLDRITTACPDRSMMMRVPGEERYLPVHLDPLGMRGPFKSLARDGGAPKSVLIVGGASQGFGFALPDEETYPAVAVRRCAMDIHNYALLGTNNEVTWDAAERTLFDQLHPDYLVLAVYFRDGHSDMAGRIAPQVENGKGFVLIDGFEFFFPRSAPAPMRRWRTLVRAYDLWARAELDLDRNTGWRPRLTPLPVQGPEPRTAKTHAALIRELADRAAARHIPLSVLLLPVIGGAPDQDLKALLPGLRVVDANLALEQAKLDDPFFPDGHYRASIAQLVGRLVGDEICGNAP